MKVYSIWLIPEPDAAKLYQAIIEHLAAMQVAPVFEPHLSMGTVGVPLDLSILAENIGPITGIAETIITENDFTRSLLVKIQKSAGIEALRSRIEAMPEFQSSRPFDPHISLCYGPPPHAASELPELSALIGRSVLFTRIVQMEVTLPVNSYDAVRQWRKVDSVRL